MNNLFLILQIHYMQLNIYFMYEYLLLLKYHLRLLYIILMKTVTLNLIITYFFMFFYVDLYNIIIL